MMSNCTLIQIDVDAFMGLSILIELDLSYNQIKLIHPGTFHPMIKIRKILLNDNELTMVSDRTFENLQHLSHVELMNNKIAFVGEQAFLNVPLKVISLSNNRLQKLEKTTFMSLTHLSSLSLGGNMWNCSCELKDFRNFVVDKKLSSDTKCHYPNALRDKSWADVGEDEFACIPRIVPRSSPAHVKASKENQTLECHVRGSPRPNVEWLFGNRLVRNNDHFRINTFESMGSKKTDDHLKHVVSELTIVGLRLADHGKYVCKATNRGGQDEYAIQLDVPSSSTIKGGAFVPPTTNTFFMILCVIVGILFIILFTIAILCCYCRRVNKYDKKPSSDNALLMSQQNGPTTKLNGKVQSDSILDGGSVIMEMQKSLLTEVNPVEKPPRRTEVDSIEKDSDDISDVKQTLLDETIFSKF
jgi:Immunoglobulin I-set domain/Leucine rich repeat